MDEERPLECPQCTKPICTVYKEVVEQTISCMHMCESCPVLEKRLHGSAGTSAEHPPLPEGLCCNGCHTSLQDVQAGGELGCTQCYSIFAGAILQRLNEQELVAPHMGNSLHVGKTPNDTGNIFSSKKVTELNEELNQALASENYEEAAWLRDQIKALMEKTDD
jgi:protein arginine kinase activator